jgi:hypothetical protein
VQVEGYHAQPVPIKSVDLHTALGQSGLVAEHEQGIGAQ